MLVRMRDPVLSPLSDSNSSAGDRSCRVAMSVIAPSSSLGSTGAVMRLSWFSRSRSVSHSRRACQGSLRSGGDAVFDLAAVASSIGRSRSFALGGVFGAAQNPRADGKAYTNEGFAVVGLNG